MEYKETPMTNIIAMIFLATILFFLCFISYYVLYTKKINRKILDGSSSKNKMLDIPKFIMISVIILLLVYSIILSSSINQLNNIHSKQLQNRDNFVEIDLSDYKYLQHPGNMNSTDASYAKVYSIDENEGYDKRVEESDNFKFTIFTRNSDYDNFHPDFLCFVEYIGKSDTKYSLYSNCTYTDSKTKSVISGVGTDTSIHTNGSLYIGNLNTDEIFELSYYFLNDKDEQTLTNDPSAEIADFAETIENVSISMK